MQPSEHTTVLAASSTRSHSDRSSAYCVYPSRYTTAYTLAYTRNLARRCQTPKTTNRTQQHDKGAKTPTFLHVSLFYGRHGQSHEGSPLLRVHWQNEPTSSASLPTAFRQKVGEHLRLHELVQQPVAVPIIQRPFCMLCFGEALSPPGGQTPPVHVELLRRLGGGGFRSLVQVFVQQYCGGGALTHLEGALRGSLGFRRRSVKNASFVCA